MSWTSILTVYRKELRDSLRDRRTLISTIVIPTVVMPLLMFAFGKIAVTLEARARQEIPRIMVIGGDDSPGVVTDLKRSPKLQIVPFAPDWKQQIADKRIRAAVEIPPGFETGLRTGVAPAVTIYDYEGETKSRYGAEELQRFFSELRQKTVAARLAERGLPPTTATVFETKTKNAAPPEKVGGALVGGLVPYIIIILCFTGAMYPGIDLTAGEKERGTMETLLCSPVARLDIVLGKFLLVLTGSLAAMFFSIVSMVLSFTLLVTTVTSHARAAAAAHATMPTIDPLGAIGVLVLVLPIAILFSAVIFSVALTAKSYKEAQSYIAPLVFIIIMPAAMAMMPGVELNARLALVPILNVSLACKEMLSGEWHWNFLGLIFASTCVYAAGALALAVKMFNREDVIFRA